MKRLLLAIFICLVTSPSFAVTTACNGSQSDCQSKVTAATAGDIITIPSGTFTWSSPVSITKGVTIQGGGSSSVINITGAGAFTIPIGTSWGDIRICYLRLTGASTSGQDMNFERGWNSLRVDHITWNTTSSRGIHVGYSTGWDDVYNGSYVSHQKMLVDHVTYNVTSGGSPFILVYGRGSRAWREDDGFGTDNFIFIEDSSFTWPSYSLGHYVTDTEYAARIVFRYNTVTNGWVGTHDFGSTPNSRGNRLVEMYNNTFTSDTYTGAYALNFVRGGTGIAFNNTITNYESINNPMIYRVGSGAGYIGVMCQDSAGIKMCQDGAKHNASTGMPDSSGSAQCTSDSGCKDATGATGKCVYIDNPSGAGGYPCRDQLGRGIDNAAGENTSSPLYWYNNTVNGVSNAAFDVGGYGAWIVSGRDYYNTPKTGYTPYTYPHPLQSGDSDVTPPVIDNLSPSGVQSCTSNPRNVTLSLTTNENSTARMTTVSSSVAYADMTDTFTNTGGQSHSEVKSLACGASYTYYVRTIDTSGNANTSSSTISFSIASPQIAGPGGLKTSGGVRLTN